MQHSVLLRHPDWISVGQSRARGQAFRGDTFLAACDLAQMFDALPDTDAWSALLPQLNGCFAVTTHRAGQLLAAVDRVRSIPLFYRSTTRGVHLSDDAQCLRGDPDAAALDEIAISEFRFSGYVTADGTLDPTIKQLRPGHFLQASNEFSTVAGTRYYPFGHQGFFEENEQTLIERLHDVHER